MAHHGVACDAPLVFPARSPARPHFGGRHNGVMARLGHGLHARSGCGAQARLSCLNHFFTCPSCVLFAAHQQLTAI